MPQVLLDLWDLMASSQNWNVEIPRAKESVCSLDRAIYATQRDADTRLSKYDLDRAVMTRSALRPRL